MVTRFEVFNASFRPQILSDMFPDPRLKSQARRSLAQMGPMTMQETIRCDGEQEWKVTHVV